MTGNAPGQDNGLKGFPQYRNDQCCADDYSKRVHQAFFLTAIRLSETQEDAEPYGT
jgi:hypothetical protein